MTSPAAAPTAPPSRVTSCGELAALVPYLVGFDPLDSLVLVALGDDRLLRCTARLDLRASPPGPLGAGEGAQDDGWALIEAVEHAVATIGGPVWAPIVWNPSGPVDHLGEALEELDHLAARLGHEVWPPVIVEGSRWQHLDCRVPDCTEGGELPAPERVPAVSDHIARGVSPLPSRAAVEEQWRVGADSARAEQVLSAVLGLESRLGPGVGAPVEGLPDVAPRLSEAQRRRALLAWRQLLHEDAVGEAELAWAVVGLGDVDLRDAVIGHLTPGTLDGIAWPGVLGRTGELLGAVAQDEESLQAVAQRVRLAVVGCPPVVGTPLLALAGTLAWWRGDGAVARVCIDQALARTPDHRLAQLVAYSISAGVRWTGAVGPSVGTNVS